jgi:hypothetical protein
MRRVKIGVIYHRSCSDGACAAWAIERLAEGHDVTLYPAAPARMPDGVGAHDLVFVADTCLPAADLARLDAATPLGVWVLDHHLSNRGLLAAHARAVFDLERSGAGLAWDEGARILHELGLRADRPPRPWLVDYIEDRDLWRHALPHSEAVNTAISARPRTPQAMAALWQELEAHGRDHGVTRLAELGRGVLVGVADAVRVACDTALPFRLGEVVGLAVASATYPSEIGHGLVARDALAAIWYVSGEAGVLMAELSFRSRDDLADARALAESLGGGGHRNASGARVPLGRWLEALAAGARGA